ncbi:MAG: SRPBCC family protein [Oceanococcus sp.]
MQAALKLERVFHASAEQLFVAWTDPRMISRWFGPEHFSVIESSIDAVVDGKYKIVIESPDGDVITHYGTYVQYSPHDSLIFTWILADQYCAGSKDQYVTTLVSLSFEVISENETRLTLTHEQLPNEEARNGHMFGWKSSFDSLQTFLSGV